VVCDSAAVDPRFLIDEAKLDRLAEVISARWPEEIAIGDIQSPALVRDVGAARLSLLETLDLSGLASR
jgi:succinylarginine dihydrolase